MSFFSRMSFSPWKNHKTSSVSWFYGQIKSKKSTFWSCFNIVYFLLCSALLRWDKNLKFMTIINSHFTFTLLIIFLTWLWEMKICWNWSTLLALFLHHFCIANNVHVLYLFTHSTPHFHLRRDGRKKSVDSTNSFCDEKFLLSLQKLHTILKR